MFDLTDNLQCNEDQVCDFAWISYHNEMLVFVLDSLAACKRGNMDIVLDRFHFKSEIGKKCVRKSSNFLSFADFIEMYYLLLFQPPLEAKNRSSVILTAKAPIGSPVFVVKSANLLINNLIVIFE